MPALNRPDALVVPVIQNGTTKKHLDSESLFPQKRKYSEDDDNLDYSTGNDFNDSNSNLRKNSSNASRGEPGNKENDLRKNSESCDIRDTHAEVLSSDSIQTLEMKTSFKKEFSETSSDVEEATKSVLRSRGHGLDQAELVDVSKLFSLKSDLLQDSFFKAREFNPNLLEAISCMKREDLGTFTGVGVKTSDETECRSQNVEEYPKTKEIEKEEDKCKSTDEEDEEDEQVDVETTDDISTTGSSALSIQVSFILSIISQ